VFPHEYVNASVPPELNATLTLPLIAHCSITSVIVPDPADRLALPPTVMSIASTYASPLPKFADQFPLTLVPVIAIVSIPVEALIDMLPRMQDESIDIEVSPLPFDSDRLPTVHVSIENEADPFPLLTDRLPVIFELLIAVDAAPTLPTVHHDPPHPPHQQLNSCSSADSHPVQAAVPASLICTAPLTVVLSM